MDIPPIAVYVRQRIIILVNKYINYLIISCILCSPEVRWNK